MSIAYTEPAVAYTTFVRRYLRFTLISSWSLLLDPIKASTSGRNCGRNSFTAGRINGFTVAPTLVTTCFKLSIKSSSNNITSSTFLSKFVNFSPLSPSYSMMDAWNFLPTNVSKSLFLNLLSTTALKASVYALSYTSLNAVLTPAMSSYGWASCNCFINLLVEVMFNGLFFFYLPDYCF